MSQPEQVISLAERLKSRREERGISQAQAARELDVARTAYRLWEMEAARPAPDRWRLIARWLGVSVTTMLLAEELVSQDEAEYAEVVAADFGRTGRDWDTVGADNPGDFFAQARALIDDAAAAADISAEQATTLAFILERIEQENRQAASDLAAEAELRRTLPVDLSAARAAEEAIEFIGSGIPEEALRTARSLVAELVTNSVRDGPAGPADTIELVIQLSPAQLRVEVWDNTGVSAGRKAPSDDVAELASRWGAGQQDGRYVAWFELDVPPPGTFR